MILKKKTSIILAILVVFGVFLVLRAGDVQAGSAIIKGINITFEKISNTDYWLSDGSLKFRFKINKSYTIDSLEKFKSIFKKVKGDVTFSDWGFRIGLIEKYNVSVWISDIVCDPYNITENETIIEIANCTDNGYYELMEKSRRVWKDFNPLGKTIQANKWYYIELWGRRDYDFHEGGAIDVDFVFAGFEFPFTIWDSYPFRYPIDSNATSIMPICLNLTPDGSPLGVCTLNASSAEGEVKYLYCVVANCTDGNWAIGNATDETAWENASSRTGYNPTDIWKNYGFRLHMDNNAGTTAFDSSANDTDFHFENTPTWVTGCIFGNCLDFTGAAQNDALNVTEITLMGEFSVSAWLYADTTSIGWIGDKGSGWTTISFYAFHAANTLEIAVSDGDGTGTICVTDAGTAVTDKWYHIGFTVSETDNEIKIYLNGSLNKTCAWTGTMVKTAGDEFYVGKRYDGNTWNGRIDEVHYVEEIKDATWFRTLHYNGIDNLTALGTEEEGVANTTPVVSLYNVSGTTNNNTPGIDFNFTDDDLKAKCYLLFNGTAYDVNSSTENATQATLTANDTLSDDDYEVKVSCSDGSNVGTSSSIILTIDTTPLIITIQLPNGTYNYNESLPLNYTVSGAIDSCWYSLDNGSNISISGCLNTTFNTTEAGNHQIKVYVNDSGGWENSTVKYFFVDPLQEIHASNNDTSDSIDAFSVTFRNTTDSATLSTTNGTLQFALYEIPWGNITLSFLAYGYNVTNFTETITNTTMLNKTYSLKPSSLSITVWDEMNYNQINFSITITNGTQTWNKTNQTSIYEYFSDLPNGEVTITISNDGYTPRRYYTVITPYSVIEIKAYLLKTTDGIFFTFHILDISRNPIEDALVTAQIYKDDYYQTVEQRRSDTSGTAFFFFDPYKEYYIKVEVDLYVSMTFWIQANPGQPWVYVYLSLTGEEGAEYVNYTTLMDCISYRIRPEYNYHADSFAVEFEISSSQNDLELLGWQIYYSNGTLLHEQNVTDQPSGSTLNHVIPNLSGSYNVKPYFKRADYSTFYLPTKTYWVYSYAGLTGIAIPIGNVAYWILTIIITLLSVGFFSKFVGFGAGFLGIAVIAFMIMLNPGLTIAGIPAWYVIVLIGIALVSLVLLRGYLR